MNIFFTITLSFSHSFHFLARKGFLIPPPLTKNRSVILGHSKQTNTAPPAPLPSYNYWGVLWYIYIYMYIFTFKVQY